MYKTIAADRERINRQHAAMILRERKQVLTGLIADGYPPNTSIRSVYQDLANGGHSLTDRIGRGFTA